MSPENIYTLFSSRESRTEAILTGKLELAEALEAGEHIRILLNDISKESTNPELDVSLLRSVYEDAKQAVADEQRDPTLTDAQMSSIFRYTGRIAQSITRGLPDNDPDVPTLLHESVDFGRISIGYAEQIAEHTEEARRTLTMAHVSVAFPYIQLHQKFPDDTGEDFLQQAFEYAKHATGIAAQLDPHDQDSINVQSYAHSCMTQALYERSKSDPAYLEQTYLSIQSMLEYIDPAEAPKNKLSWYFKGVNTLLRTAELQHVETEIVSQLVLAHKLYNMQKATIQDEPKYRGILTKTTARAIRMLGRQSRDRAISNLQEELEGVQQQTVRHINVESLPSLAGRTEVDTLIAEVAQDDLELDPDIDLSELQGIISGAQKRLDNINVNADNARSRYHHEIRRICVELERAALLCEAEYTEIPYEQLRDLYTAADAGVRIGNILRNFSRRYTDLRDRARRIIELQDEQMVQKPDTGEDDAAQEDIDPIDLARTRSLEDAATHIPPGEIRDSFDTVFEHIERIHSQPADSESAQMPNMLEDLYSIALRLADRLRLDEGQTGKLHQLHNHGLTKIGEVSNDQIKRIMIDINKQLEHILGPSDDGK